MVALHWKQEVVNNYYYSYFMQLPFLFSTILAFSYRVLVRDAQSPSGLLLLFQAICYLLVPKYARARYRVQWRI